MSTHKSQTKDFEFKKGYNSNLSNDDVPIDQLRYISDAREVEVGKWRTRLGSDFLSVPIGEAVNAQQTSVTGAGTFAFNAATRFAKKFTATASGPLTAIEVNLRNANAASGTVVYALYTDVTGSPGVELMRTTVPNSAIATSLGYVKARTISCPDLVNGTSYWIVGFVQDGGSGSYEVSTTTNAATGKTSTSSGTTWTTTSLDFNVKVSSSTAGGVKGVIRVKRPSGTNYTFFAHGTTLYSVNETTGATAAVDTALDTNATYCRFVFVNDVLYYVTGLQKPRKYDFVTAAEVTTAPENASAIVEHKGVVFYISAIDLTKMFYTNFAIYDTFTSTDFIYVPAPKKADAAKAFATLNGVLYIITRTNKHVLYGAENATFRLDNAVGQKGTFSQESVAYDQTAIYLASDDGIYRFNGAEEKNIAEDFLGEWTELLNKSNTVLELHDNRLFIYYTPNGESKNTRCFVWNTLYQILESNDTLGYVARAYSRFESDNLFLQGSNRVGMVMLGETSTNDHTAMGEPLTWELDTSYVHYDSPAQYKRAPLYRPHFDTESGSYSVQVGYATDYNDSPTFSNIALQAGGARFNQGYTFDSGVHFGGVQQVNPMDSGITIPGEWRRLQLRYRHYAAREPVSFDGHVLSLETQRLI